MKMKQISLLFLCLILLCSCTRTAMQLEEFDLKDIDKQFSDYSIKHGLNAAFLKYIRKDGVILKENSMPIEGIKNVRELYKNADSGIQLSWETRYASVARSGDLGYTYGTFDLWKKSSDTHSYGTYVTIWKRNALGQWRFVLDSGNQGLKPIE